MDYTNKMYLMVQNIMSQLKENFAVYVFVINYDRPLLSMFLVFAAKPGYNGTL